LKNKLSGGRVRIWDRLESLAQSRIRVIETAGADGILLLPHHLIDAPQEGLSATETTLSFTGHVDAPL